jgi:hypothetical protein
MNILITGIDNLSCKGSDTNVETLRQLGIDVRIGDVRDADALATLCYAGFSNSSHTKFGLKL